MLILLVVGTYGPHDDLIQAFKYYEVIASTILEATVPVLLMRGIYKVRRLHGLRWHDIHTKFHKARLRRSEVVGGECRCRHANTHAGNKLTQ
jgi:hypothetical protein